MLKELRGKTGAIGPQGAIGATGAPGPAGAAGAAGPTGPAGGTGSTGPQGPPGKEGAPGKEGPPAKLGALEEVRGEFSETSKDTKGEFLAASFAECPTGSKAISGGSFIEEGRLLLAQASEAVEIEFEGKMHRGWGVFGFFTAEAGGTEAVAYCAPEGVAVTAAKPLSAAARRGIEEQLVAKITRRR